MILTAGKYRDVNGMRIWRKVMQTDSVSIGSELLATDKTIENLVEKYSHFDITIYDESIS